MKDNPMTFSPIGGPLCLYKKKKRLRIVGDYEISGKS